MVNTYLVYPVGNHDSRLDREFHTYKHAGNYANYLVECGIIRVTIDILLHSNHTTTLLQSFTVTKQGIADNN